MTATGYFDIIYLLKHCRFLNQSMFVYNSIGRGSDIFKILARIAFVEVKDPVNEIGFCALDPFNETEIIKF